ncbi:MAG: hypothetical protein RLZZ480_890 [Candidatus Parcubacteria bacterium]|jgi:hypothetical protein
MILRSFPYLGFDHSTESEYLLNVPAGTKEDSPTGLRPTKFTTNFPLHTVWRQHKVSNFLHPPRLGPHHL